MKTAYIIPKVSSLEDNRIIDLYNIEVVPMHTRIVILNGTEVRIKINKDYVELNSYEDVDLSRYNEMFKKLMNFFYGKAYLYGVVDSENNLLIYDIYTNENYLSTRDMKVLEKTCGLPVVKPVVEGKLNFTNILNVMNDDDFFAVLPSVYINDNRKISCKEKEVDTKIIFGEKPVYKPTYSYTYNKKDDVSVAKVVEQTETKVVEQTETKKEKPEVFLLSSKEERTAIYNETYKNLSNSVAKKNKTLSEDCLKWWKKFGKKISYIYAIHTLPATRGIVYEYARNYLWEEDFYYYNYNDTWAYLFMDMFVEKYNIKINYDDYIYFAEIFEEELNEFKKFYEKENFLHSFDDIGDLINV